MSSSMPRHYWHVRNAKRRGAMHPLIDPDESDVRENRPREFLSGATIGISRPAPRIADEHDDDGF